MSYLPHSVACIVECHVRISSAGLATGRNSTTESREHRQSQKVFAVSSRLRCL